jgi:hypothetical protein
LAASARAEAGAIAQTRTASPAMAGNTKPLAVSPVWEPSGVQAGNQNRAEQVFNYERPHEGLNNATPGSVYQPSSVLLRRNPIEFVYPHGFMLRRVNNSGDISWHKGWVFISEVFFRFEILGFEQVDEDFYKVYFRDVEIGEFDAEALRFRPVQVMR